MHRYEVQFKYNLDKNGGCTRKTVEITYPKRVYAFTDVYGNDGKGRNEILTKAVNELGLDPSMVDALADRTKLDGGWYKLNYLGEVKANNESAESTSSNNISRKEVIARGKRDDKDRDAYLDSLLSKNKTIQKSPEQIHAERQVEIQRIADKKKSDQEFFQNMKKYWFIWVPLVVAFVIWFNVSSNNKQNAKDEAIKLNQQLERVEDDIKVAIQNNEKDKALELTNKLIHPSHILYEGKGELFSDEYYDTYWNKKREEYKKILFQENSSNSEKIEVKKSVAKENIDDVEVIDRETDSLNDAEDIPEEYRN